MTDGYDEKYPPPVTQTTRARLSRMLVEPPRPEGACILANGETYTHLNLTAILGAKIVNC